MIMQSKPNQAKICSRSYVQENAALNSRLRTPWLSSLVQTVRLSMFQLFTEIRMYSTSAQLELTKFRVSAVATKRKKCLKGRFFPIVKYSAEN